jgi:hypothetical protein
VPFRGTAPPRFCVFRLFRGGHRPSSVVAAMPALPLWAFLWFGCGLKLMSNPAELSGGAADVRSPIYVMLRRRSKRLALLWLLGHAALLIGKLGLAAGPGIVLLAYFWRQYLPFAPGQPATAVLCAVLIAGAFAALVVCSVALKAYARKRGGPLDSLGQQ